LVTKQLVGDIEDEVNLVALFWMGFCVVLDWKMVLEKCMKERERAENLAFLQEVLLGKIFAVCRVPQ